MNHLIFPRHGGEMQMMDMSSGSWKDLDAGFSATLYAHIVFGLLAFALLMPIGSSLAISKRFPGWHVIIQVVASVAAGIGYLLGDAAHHESKRLKATEAAAGAAGTSEDPPHNHNILLLEKRHASGGKRVIGLKSHETLAQIILFLISVQVAAGLAVKLCKIYWVRWGKRFSKTRLVSMCRICHQYLGRIFVLIGYCEMVLGFVVAAKACENDNLNNCTAHILMGSSFLGFGVFGMLAPFLVSLSYFKSWSREWYESLVIMIWGIINTLTLGLNWTIRDRQHVSMGVLFWVGGSLGLMFEWRFIRNSFITRGVNPLPGLVLAYTGYSMMSHHQSTGFSSSLHSFFGSTLLLASVLKIVLTVVFVQHRTSISSSHPSNIHHHNEEDDADDVDFLQASASLTTPQPSPYTMRLEFLLHVLSNFLFILAGITFMASNEESVNRMQNLLDSSAFVNILIGVAMLVYGLCAFLITLAMGNSRNSNGRGVGINNAADNEMLPHHLPRPLPQQEFEGDITPRISSSNNSINSQKSLAGATEENTFFMKSIKLGGLGASPRRTVVARSLFNDSDQVDEFKSQADELLQQ